MQDLVKVRSARCRVIVRRAPLTFLVEPQSDLLEIGMKPLEANRVQRMLRERGINIE